MTTTGRAFHITVAGEVGPATREAFVDLDVQVVDGSTVLTGELIDQPALHSTLERVHALGLVLVELHVDD